MKNLFLVLSVFIISLTGCTEKQLRLPDVTVRITNLEQNSGGSGSIIVHSPTHSFVLTNAHVCEVVKNGGYVQTDSEQNYPVVSFRQSKEHDLCLIRVNSDLKVSADIAENPPERYSVSYTSGHPRLLPTIITKGHFSGKQLIRVLVGAKECTEEDRRNPDTAFVCAIVGRLPLIKTYSSQVTSNLIQPGSSGSAVFNAQGEVSSVIFAGSGELSFAFAVPYEHIVSFIAQEYRGLKDQIPDSTNSGTKNSFKTREYLRKIINLCSENENAKNSSVCKSLGNFEDLLYYN